MRPGCPPGAAPFSITGAELRAGMSGIVARLFYLSVAGGVLLALLVAGLFPLPQSPRFRSAINVIPDGGREETFLIEWHQDRLRPVPAAHAPPLALAGGVVLAPGADGAVAATAEVFRLRDVSGNVIGIASRTVSARGADIRAGSGSQWMLLLPGRGTLFLSQVNARDITPRAVAAGGELLPAVDAPATWSGGKQLAVTAGPAEGGAGRVEGGTEEFDGLQGSYRETWELYEETTASGRSRGRIRLVTRLEAGAT